MARSSANSAAKRKAGRKGSGKRGGSQQTPPAEPPPGDLMTQCVQHCQDQQWRQALSLFYRMCEKAKTDGNDVMYESLSQACLKVEYSLRRQMAASLIHASRDLLAKEFLLDVGEE